MKYQSLVKRIVLCSAAILSIANIDSSVASAKRIHKHRIYVVRMHSYRKHKHQRYWQNIKMKHRHISHYDKFSLVRIEHINDQGSKLANSIRNSLFYTINQTRLSNGLKELRPSVWLQKAANYRSSHVQRAYEIYQQHNRSPKFGTESIIHGYSNNTSFEHYLHVHHMHVSNWAENASDFTVGNPQYQSDNTLAPYDNSKPEGIARNIDDDFMNHDVVDGNHNDHRTNELNPYVKYVSVGVRYNPRMNYGSITEDYAS